jgi:hypothetical protein
MQCLQLLYLLERISYSNIQNPLTLNRYDYVLNNPETMNDPSGHWYSSPGEIPTSYYNNGGGGGSGSSSSTSNSNGCASGNLQECYGIGPIGPGSGVRGTSAKPSLTNYFVNTWIPNHYATFILALFGSAFSLLGIDYLVSGLSPTDSLGQALILSAMGSGLDLGALANEWATGDYSAIGRTVLGLAADGIATVVHYMNVFQYIETGVTLVSEAATGFLTVAISAMSIGLTVSSLYSNVQNDYNQAYG